VGCDTVYSGISLPAFLRDVLPPSSGSKGMTSNQQEASSKQSVDWRMPSSGMWECVVLV
jgi:hypothetical protein